MNSSEPPHHNPRRWYASEAPVADVDMPFDIDGLHTLRAALATHARLLGAPNDQVDHLLVVADELATNAIRHGGGTGWLRMWHRERVLYCQIIDEGPGIADPTLGTVPPDPMDGDSNRGLWICRNLASELVFEVDPDGSGTVATAAIPPPSGTHPGGNGAGGNGAAGT